MERARPRERKSMLMVHLGLKDTGMDGQEE